jgi:hypothetical protein
MERQRISTRERKLTKERKEKRERKIIKIIFDHCM